MKSSQYREWMELSRNRYQAYIRYNEANITGELISDEESQAAAMELMQLGYVLYAEPSGIIDGRFFNQALTIAKETEPYLIYCDEDMLIEDERCNPFFKPDFSPDTLESFFYVGGLFLLKENSEQFGIALTEENAPDIRELILKKFKEDKSAFNKSHIPAIYFNARNNKCYQYSDKADNAGNNAENVQVDCVDDNKISCIILSKDNVDMLLSGIDSLITYSDLPMEYIVVDNGSSAENKERLTKELAGRNIIYIYHPMEFEYSTLCNIGAKAAAGDVFLFLNDDVKATEETKGFPSKLLSKVREAHVGAAGAKLLYPEHREKKLIQHAGITLLASGPSHKMCTYSDNEVYERGRNRGQWNVLGVTGACLMVSREHFEKVGGFDESLKVAYTDVDLCLDLLEAGFYNVVINDVELLHYESVSRGSDVADETKLARLDSERKIFYNKHLWLTEKGDPFYNTNLSPVSLEYLPDYTYPWEQRIYAKERSGEVTVQCLNEGRLMYSIDRISFIRESLEEEGFYEIEGWAIMHGKNQLSYSPAIVLQGENIRIFEATAKPRWELLKIFPAERYTLFSGFVCRIKESEIKGQTYTVGAAKLSKGLFGREKCCYILSDKRLGE